MVAAITGIDTSWDSAKLTTLHVSTAWQNQQNDICAQRRLRSAWADVLLSAWRNLGSLATHWAHSEDSYLDSADVQADLSLCWVQVILLVVSSCSSYVSSERLRLACTSVESDQSLLGTLWIAKDPKLPYFKWPANTYQTACQCCLIWVFALHKFCRVYYTLTYTCLTSDKSVEDDNYLAGENWRWCSSDSLSLLTEESSTPIPAAAVVSAAAPAVSASSSPVVLSNWCWNVHTPLRQS